MVLRIKNFNILGVRWKIRFLGEGGGGGGGTKNQYIGGIAWKGGGLGQFVDLRGVGLARKRWVVFLRGEVIPNAHYGYVSLF